MLGTGQRSRRRRREVPSGEDAAMRALIDQFSQLPKLYRRLETCGKPIVAAINGTALGGGFETASPAITASRGQPEAPASACPRSRSACCRAPAARSASRA